MQGDDVMTGAGPTVCEFEGVDPVVIFRVISAVVDQTCSVADANVHVLEAIVHPLGEVIHGLSAVSRIERVSVALVRPSTIIVTADAAGLAAHQFDRILDDGAVLVRSFFDVADDVAGKLTMTGSLV